MSGTHWKQNFNYKYTGAYELPEGQTRTLRIQRLCNEDVCDTSGKKQLCFVAYFDGQSKPMVLNKTNCKTIEKLYGPIIEQWIGKQITIESKKVKAFGEMVDALRVKHSVPKPSNTDNSKYEQQLSNCKNLGELKSVYTGLPPEVKFALSCLKDSIKSKLEGGQN